MAVRPYPGPPPGDLAGDMSSRGCRKELTIHPTLPTLTLGVKFFDYDRAPKRQHLISANSPMEPGVNRAIWTSSYAEPPQRLP